MNSTPIAKWWWAISLKLRAFVDGSVPPINVSRDVPELQDDPKMCDAESECFMKVYQKPELKLLRVLLRWKLISGE